MRKYVWIAVIVLIAGTVYFTSCERIPKEMMDTIMPDAGTAETPPEMVETPPEMVETQTGLVDVMIYTGASWWITTENATIEAEITRNLLQTAEIATTITESEEEVRNWMLQTTANGTVNVLVVYGVIPNSIYPSENTQPDGSIAENWIETTDGDTILNQSDYFGYSSTTTDETVRIASHGNLYHGANSLGNLRHLMDHPNIFLDTGSSDVSMLVTAEGNILTPSLVNPTSDRPFPLNELQGDWFAEKVFASDTGDENATLADPVILRDGDHGRLAIVLQTGNERIADDDPEGEVAAEIIINYFLAK